MNEISHIILSGSHLTILFPQYDDYLVEGRKFNEKHVFSLVRKGYQSLATITSKVLELSENSR